MAMAARQLQRAAKDHRGRHRSKYGVAASPRVVAEGEPVPKGGGREMLGKPYLVAGRLYSPRIDPNYAAVGTASWYGSAFHGRLTANGEIFDRESVAAAHPTLPLPSYVRVTNLRNSSSMVVRVNDRGPYHGNRVLDVSQRVAEALDFKQFGTARVRVEYLGRASIRGSDDRKLLATLRTDGDPATLPGGGASVLVASNETPVPQTPRRAASFATASASSASYATASYTPASPQTANVEATSISASDNEMARAVFQAAAAEPPAPRVQTASAVSLAPLHRHLRRRPPRPPPASASPAFRCRPSGHSTSALPPRQPPANPGPVARVSPANRVASALPNNSGDYAGKDTNSPARAPGLFYAAEQAEVLRVSQAQPLHNLSPQQYVLFQRVASN